MRRSPMPDRKTPLEAKTSLRRTAFNRSPNAASLAHERAKRSNQPSRGTANQPAVPPIIRIALTVRSGGVCEMAFPDCMGQATDPAHRIRTGMGGRKRASKTAHDVLSNLVHACRRCHSWTHAEPAKAYAMGLMLRDGSNPLKEPVVVRGRWVLLDNQGSITPTTKED